MARTASRFKQSEIAAAAKEAKKIGMTIKINYQAGTIEFVPVNGIINPATGQVIMPANRPVM